jgi:hypothetical protein
MRYCTVGIFSLLNDEYGTHSDNDISECTVGIWDRSGGNTKWANCTVQNCTVDGFRLSGGGNADHAVVTGCTFNHNLVNVNIESTNLGELFVSCCIEYPPGGGHNIVFGSVGVANKVIFANCNIYNGDMVGTNAVACAVRDCNDLGSTSHSGSGVIYVNNNNTTDPQYWRSSLNAIGANGGAIGTSDNYDFSIKTNNTARINVLNTGEVGIGVAGAAGFKMFIVSAGNTSGTYHSLYRNGNAENIFTILDDGSTGIGNANTGANTNTFYGTQKFNAKSFAGGTTAPTALLHIAAGTASANTAPLKFTSGTNLTTPEDGAVEYNGSNLQLDVSTTRYTLDKSLTGSATLDFASTGSGAVADLTITVTGASVGDVVVLGVPNGSVTATATFTAWVSATDTVTVRFSPKATEDPASGTFKVRVIK